MAIGPSLRHPSARGHGHIATPIMRPRTGESRRCTAHERAILPARPYVRNDRPAPFGPPSTSDEQGTSTTPRTAKPMNIGNNSTVSCTAKLFQTGGLLPPHRSGLDELSRAGEYMGSGLACPFEPNSKPRCWNLESVILNRLLRQPLGSKSPTRTLEFAPQSRSLPMSRRSPFIPASGHHLPRPLRRDRPVRQLGPGRRPGPEGRRAAAPVCHALGDERAAHDPRRPPRRGHGRVRSSGVAGGRQLRGETRRRDGRDRRGRVPHGRLAAPPLRRDGPRAEGEDDPPQGGCRGLPAGHRRRLRRAAGHRRRSRRASRSAPGSRSGTTTAGASTPRWGGSPVDPATGSRSTPT